MSGDREPQDLPEPPGWPRPPGWTEDWHLGKGSQARNPVSWYDPTGAEWRWHEQDDWHDEAHWDYKGNLDVTRQGINVSAWLRLDSNGQLIEER
jgi:hypothetical protein